MNSESEGVWRIWAKAKTADGQLLFPGMAELLEEIDRLRQKKLPSGAEVSYWQGIAKERDDAQEQIERLRGQIERVRQRNRAITNERLACQGLRAGLLEDCRRQGAQLKEAEAEVDRLRGVIAKPPPKGVVEDLIEERTELQGNIEYWKRQVDRIAGQRDTFRDSLQREEKVGAHRTRLVLQNADLRFALKKILDEVQQGHPGRPDYISRIAKKALEAK